MLIDKARLISVSELEKFDTMSQFGKCNVCATPCVSCMRHGQELFPMESTSNFSSDESCEYEVSCEQGSETSTASSLKSEGSILDANNDKKSFVVGAGPSLLAECQRIDMDKMNKTGHLCSCFMDQTESSSSITMAQAANEEQNQVVVDSKKPIKFECAENSANNSVNCNCSNHEEGNNSNGESTLSDYVKVCDICGVAGQEEFLAVCSKCRIGVEHVYCMRIMLDTVPDGNWICEECALSEDKDKMTKTKFEKFAACPKYKSSNHSDQGGEILNSSNLKVLPRINAKELDADKNGGDEASSLLSANKTSGNVACASMTKKLAIGTECVPSFMSRDCSKAQPQDFEREASNKLSLPNDPSSQLRRIQEKSGQSLPTFRQIQMETGNLRKPKSFNDSEKRPKVQRLDEIPHNGKFFIHKKEKGSTVRTMRKALHSNVLGPNSKRIPPKFSNDGGLKRLRCMKEHTSVEMIPNTRFKRLQVGSTKDGPFVSASSHDMKSRFHCEITLPDVDAAKTHDLKAVEVSNDSAIASNGKSMCAPVADVVPDVLFPIASDASREVKCKGERFRHSLEARIPCSYSDATGDEKLTVLLTSSDGTEKAPQTDFIYTNESMSNRSGSKYYGRIESLGHASCCPMVHGCAVSVLNTPVGKDMDGSSKIDVNSSFFNQINAYRTLAVPVIDYIWRGECEIQNSSRLPWVLYRIQAHLSTWSSSKIPEAVKKFSNKILLEEVSRLTVWPIQFQESYPQDNDIGLYFFAEDVESYGNYKSLLQYMVDFDIALIRNFNRIELLIFTSHLLPESSRYWNGLLFLWGVFKERKVNVS